MRIVEFSIRRYGPLRETGVVRLNSFNLFWGENENGKTLLTEALIRLLLGKQSRLFAGIDRVEEMPEGFLVLEDADRREWKLPQAGDITSLTGLTARECRNLFIIHNSDLIVTQEAAFYSEITERLTGLRSTQIQRLKSILRRRGRFTEGMDTVNTRESGYLKNRLAAAAELIERCEELLETAGREGDDRAEERLVRLQHRKRQLEERLAALESARLQNKHQKGREHLKLLEEAARTAARLPKFTEDGLEDWRRLEKTIEQRVAEKGKVSEEFRNTEAELLQEEYRLEKLQEEMEHQQKRRWIIDEKLRPLLRQWQLLRPRAAQSAAKRFLWRGAAVAAGLLLLLLVLNRSLSLLALAPPAEVAAGAAAGVLLLLYYGKIARPQSLQKSLAAMALGEAIEAGFRVNSLPQLEQEITEFERESQELLRERSAAEGRITFLKNTCRLLREERLSDLERRIHHAQQDIRMMISRYEVLSWQDYRKKLEERRESERRIRESAAVLSTLFGQPFPRPLDNVNFWRQKITAMPPQADPPPKSGFDEAELIAVKNELGEVNAEHSTVRRRLSDLREQLKEVDRQVRQVLSEEVEFSGCQTLYDLQNVQHLLRQFIDRVSAEQNAARSAIEILDEIEQQEQRKVALLFGEGSPVSEYFADITAGMYPSVDYDSGASRLTVRRRDGKELPPAALSGGTYDQLYLAIRLALGEKRLGNEKGFLLLDDPFLKSDSRRLRRQMEMLLALSQSGWQILYFTAKDEVRHILQPFAERRQVIFQRLPGLFNEVRGARLKSEKKELSGD